MVNSCARAFQAVDQHIVAVACTDTTKDFARVVLTRELGDRELANAGVRDQPNIRAEVGNEFRAFHATRLADGIELVDESLDSWARIKDVDDVIVAEALRPQHGERRFGVRVRAGDYVARGVWQQRNIDWIARHQVCDEAMVSGAERIGLAVFHVEEFRADRVPEGRLALFVREASDLGHCLRAEADRIGGDQHQSRERQQPAATAAASLALDEQRFSNPLDVLSDFGFLYVFVFG